MVNKKKYIFPMNYSQKEKFLGIVDYKVLTFIVILVIAFSLIIRNFEIEIFNKVVIFIFVVGMPSIFVLIGVNGENMVDFMLFVIKYSFREKVYVYKKVEEVTTFEKVYKKLVPDKTN